MCTVCSTWRKMHPTFFFFFSLKGFFFFSIWTTFLKSCLCDKVIEARLDDYMITDATLQLYCDKLESLLWQCWGIGIVSGDKTLTELIKYHQHYWLSVNGPESRPPDARLMRVFVKIDRCHWIFSMSHENRVFHWCLHFVKKICEKK